MKREELNLTSVENTAHMTMALDQDVWLRVALGTVTPSAKHRDHVQQADTELDAISTSKPVKQSDSPATKFSKKPTKRDVLRTYRIGRIATTRNDAAIKLGSSSGTGYASSRPRRDGCKVSSTRLKASRSIGRSTATVEKWSMSKALRMKTKKSTKLHCKLHGSHPQKRLVRGLGKSKPGDGSPGGIWARCVQGKILNRIARRGKPKDQGTGLGRK